MPKIGWSAVGKMGAVAAGAAESVSAGMEILERGGNASDAAAATIFALNVTDHGACSIGGEVPVLIFDAETKTVKSLSGQGCAPLSEAAIRWYMENGIPDADMKMAPVPSVVDLCVTVLQQYGTMTFSDIISPALELLDAGGEEWHIHLAATLRRLVDEEHRTRGNRETCLQAVSDRFYGRHAERNDIAEELEAFYIEHGGFLRREDLAAHRTLIENPVSVAYRGYTVFKCGPWTQGPFLCQALRLLEGFNLKEMGHLSADYIHVVVEAIKLCMADRDAHYGDPDFVDVPMTELLSETYTELRRPLIDMNKASQEARPGSPRTMTPLLTGQGLYRPGIGGTTTCVVADRWGNVVSATPSANVYREGGSDSTGISFGNRLRSLNTTPGHPNCIAPGKRPRTTLTPTLVLKERKPVFAVSVAGGDLQDQVTLNLLLDAIEFGMEPAQAVLAPRFVTSHHQNSFDPDPVRERTFVQAGSLTINDTVDKKIREDLVERGHWVRVTGEPVAHPVMLYVNTSDGLYYVAGDPATGRHAAGLQDG